MGFRINTNIGAMNAHMSATMNNRELDNSLSRLSSGLRINKAADDASGMTIANSLRAQSKGLGQAISNANDGIAVAQTADGALDEYSSIIQTVRTKSIQAASDGQSADSRKAIQSDINKLLEEAQNIAKTTSFNGQNLLDGNFTNKSFQIGAYANQTVAISIGDTKTASIGAISSVTNASSTTGLATWTAFTGVTQQSETSTGYTVNAGLMTVNGTDIASSLNNLSPLSLQDAKATAAAITDATGIMAQAKTVVTGAAVTAGTIDSTNFLKINGYSIGTVTTTAADASGALLNAINSISDKTGVTAVNKGGKMELTAADGRNISITTGATADTLSGLTANGTTVTGAVVAALTDAVLPAVTIAKGDLVINGVDMAGTYGDGTVGTARLALQSAIQNIEGMSQSSIDTTGFITLVVDNGQDANVAGATANSVFKLAKGATNTSDKGVVSIFSNDKVSIGGTTPGLFGFTAGTTTPVADANTSLAKVNVLDAKSAQVSILIADAALKAIDSVRSGLGSVQNQLESTIRNISVTQVNVASAESQIRDVDFAAESANFSKRNILAQSGSYAMSQANAVQQNVLRLLQ